MDKKINKKDTTSLYDNKADLYQARAKYAPEAIDYIIKKMNINSSSIIADVGAGTGILSSQIFDSVSCKVMLIEPNADMIRVAKNNLSSPKIAFLKKTAESTGVENDSIDAVVVGTAFHWFDMAQFKLECQRICKANAKIALLRLYNFVPDVDQNNTSEMHSIANFDEQVRAFFGDGGYEKKLFFHEETFDETRFVNERLSDHKSPNPSDDGYLKFIEDSKKVFAYFGSPVINNIFVTVCFVGGLK